MLRFVIQFTMCFGYGHVWHFLSFYSVVLTGFEMFRVVYSVTWLGCEICHTFYSVLWICVEICHAFYNVCVLLFVEICHAFYKRVFDISTYR